MCDTCPVSSLTNVETEVERVEVTYAHLRSNSKSHGSEHMNKAIIQLDLLGTSVCKPSEFRWSGDIYGYVEREYKQNKRSLRFDNLIKQCYRDKSK